VLLMIHFGSGFINIYPNLNIMFFFRRLDGSMWVCVELLRSILGYELLCP